MSDQRPGVLDRPELTAALEKVGQQIFMTAFRKATSDKALEAAAHLQDKGVFNHAD